HNAQEKCVKKNCDLLIGNNLFTQGAGFQTPTNVVTLFTKDTIQPLGKMSKEEVGELILKTMKQMEDHNTCS
ncbi:phosphopantothenoylcysteine decarboxylase domain-containing protein, partial [Dubosiella newyorkensis]